MKKQAKKTASKVIAVILTSILVLMCFAGCGDAKQGQDSDGSTSAPNSSGNQPDSTTAPSGESKVVVGLAHDPQNIGPFQGMSPGRIGILYTAYEFLAIKEGGEMYGVLMKDYKKIDDLTYNCEIYDYIYDQAGNHLTAEDVAFSYNSGIEYGNLPKLRSINSVEAISEYVVQFKFDTLSIGDLGALWMECPIVTKAAFEASADQMATDPITTTAYKCTEFVSGSKMVFTKTDSYWQTDESKLQNTSKHNVDVIEFDIIPDGSQLTNALKTGAIDVTNWLSDVDVEDFMGKDGFDVTPVPDNLTYFLVYNCDEEQGAFANNKEFRQAIAYAIDLQQIVDGAFDGNGNIAKTWGNTNYADYVESWLDEDYYDTDLDKARQLLAESGVSDLNINLMIVSGDVTTKIATIMQAQLAQIGVTVNINPYDAQLSNTYKYQPEQWDLMLDQAGSTSYLVNVWKLAWDRSGYKHDGAMNFVKDDQLQSLLETAMDVDSHDDASMDAFHQYLKEQCYGIGLAQSMTNIAHTTKISKIVVDARGQTTPGACEYSFK
ncbi:MAG: ABC transporter substrate-binding protein [Clostridiaceae bacterium]|nr:ABC transporter substrate-binding protein [Clostridiaceae bacterium]